MKNGEHGVMFPPTLQRSGHSMRNVNTRDSQRIGLIVKPSPLRGFDLSVYGTTGRSQYYRVLKNKFE